MRIEAETINIEGIGTGYLLIVEGKKEVVQNGETLIQKIRSAFKIKEQIVKDHYLQANEKECEKEEVEFHGKTELNLPPEKPEQTKKETRKIINHSQFKGVHVHHVGKSTYQQIGNELLIGRKGYPTTVLITTDEIERLKSNPDAINEGLQKLAETKRTILRMFLADDEIIIGSPSKKSVVEVEPEIAINASNRFMKGLGIKEFPAKNESRKQCPICEGTSTIFNGHDWDKTKRYWCFTCDRSFRAGVGAKPDREVLCPNCTSNDTITWGTRGGRGVKKEQFMCRACKNKFSGLKLKEPEAAPVTAQDWRILTIAKERIDITGQVNPEWISEKLGIPVEDVTDALTRTKTELDVYKEHHEESKYEKKLHVQTGTGYDGNKVEVEVGSAWGLP